MRVLICGYRHWKDWRPIRREVELLLLAHGRGSVMVIHGAAPGADSIAAEVALEFGLPVEPYPADWKRYGRAAGPKRNQQMLDEGRPDLVLAFHPNLEESKGTKDMVERAKKAGVHVEVYDR